ncbi:hypothetical protein ABT282_07420 [Streptomyces sp. NPDC000927]|uniref:hypothetical protein n=1 Tax=Streptomyces sp. NPDC000927 TaxID=3154371 RepID=UPI00332A45AF
MNTTRIKITDAKPGMLIPGWGGVVVLDTLSATDGGVSFWYDTNGKQVVLRLGDRDAGR